MKSYIVNLKRSVDRRNYIEETFYKIGYSNYEFVEAVDGNDLTDLELKQNYNFELAERLCKPLTRLEIACALSHIKVQEKIIKDNSNYHTLILEDDIIPTDKFNLMKDLEIEQELGNNILMFNGISGNVLDELPINSKNKLCNFSYTDKNLKSFLYLKEESFIDLDVLKIYEIEDRSYKINFKTQAFAYSPTIESCKKYISINNPVILPADFVWNIFHDFKLYCPQHNIFNTKSQEHSIIEYERMNIKYDQFSKSFKKRMSRKDFNF
jgi:GR25 family glycosyltransferase involved in LPS biosynthesis